MDAESLYYIVDGQTGKVVAEGLKKNFQDIVAELNKKQNSGDYALKSELTSLATKTEVSEGLAGKQAKGDYATKTELSNKTIKTAKLVKGADGVITSGTITLTDETEIQISVEQSE